MHSHTTTQAAAQKPMACTRGIQVHLASASSASLRKADAPACSLNGPTVAYASGQQEPEERESAWCAAACRRECQAFRLLGCSRWHNTLLAKGSRVHPVASGIINFRLERRRHIFGVSRACWVHNREFSDCNHYCSGVFGPNAQRPVLLLIVFVINLRSAFRVHKLSAKA